MLRHRVIPCLLLRTGGLVKTRKFRDPKYVGDPVNAIRIFNEKEVDELMVLDIVASKKGVEPDYEMVERFAGECFMPLCYGGGIRNIKQAERLFSLGVEKICLQTAALDSPTLVSQIAERYGSQSVVVSIDIAKNFWGKNVLYRSADGSKDKRSWETFLERIVESGAGEIVLNAVQREGTMEGYDLDLIAQAARRVSVPLIALGGAGKVDDFREAVKAGASAVAAGSMFVFHGPHRAVLISYPSYRDLESLWS